MPTEPEITKAVGPRPWTVKALEWEERSGAHYAGTILGDVCIDADRDGFYVIENGRKHSEFASVDAAKEFVQANHDKHVSDWLEAARPALVAEPAPVTPIGFARKTDIEDRPFEGRTSFWCSERQNVYYDTPVYAAPAQSAAPVRQAAPSGEGE